MIALFHVKMFYCYLLTNASSYQSNIAMFGAFVYDSAEKQMLNAIPLVIEQRKNEFDRIAKVRIFPIYFYAFRG
jgi:hypothetical protein